MSQAAVCKHPAIDDADVLTGFKAIVATRLCADLVKYLGISPPGEDLPYLIEISRAMG
ncbi:MAG: hypothetical protein ACRYG8_45780 [Janthinobacterium lividum]